MLQKTPRVPFFLILFLMGFFLLTFEKGHGEPSKPFLEGPIHESYITRTSDNVILEATPQQPPDPLIERSPRQVDIQAEWIPGYWAWDKNNTDFIWVSGVWRRPPPRPPVDRRLLEKIRCCLGLDIGLLESFPKASCCLYWSNSSRSN